MLGFFLSRDIEVLTDEKFMRLVEAHDGNNRAIAQACGLHIRSVQRRRAMLAHRGVAPAQGLKDLYPEGFHLGKVTIQRGAGGEIERTWERMCADDQHRMEIMRQAIEAMAKDLPRVSPIALPNIDRPDLMCVYPFGDPHVGMYSWAAETGDDWDLELAEQIHCDAMHLVVSATPKSRYGWVLNLGDLFHYDSLEAKTPRSGHFLDADGRYAKMVQVGIRMMRRCIDTALQKHEIVFVNNMPGNHDETGALWLSQALQLVYENEPRVMIETSPSVFAYRRFGKVLLGSHHGHTCKPDKLPLVMATDMAKDWGEALHRHWLTGHIHHEMRKEFGGCTVESFNTLAAKDAYAHTGGWRSARSLTSLVYHEEFGEVGRSRVSLPMVEAKQRKK